MPRQLNNSLLLFGTQLLCERVQEKGTQQRVNDVKKSLGLDAGDFLVGTLQHDKKSN